MEKKGVERRGGSGDEGGGVEEKGMEGDEVMMRKGWRSKGWGGGERDGRRGGVEEMRGRGEE